MKKTMIAMALLLCLLCGMLAACSEESSDNGNVTTEKAQQIVMDHAGVTADEVSDVHVHLVENDEGAVCYSIHISFSGKTYTYLVHGTTGEILSVEEGSSH